MKLVLVNPAFFDGEQFRNRFDHYLEWIKGGNLYVAPFEPPLGLASLAAALKGRGHQVTLLDMQGSVMDTPELERRLRAEKPDLVGITAMTPTLPEALRVAERARAVVPSAGVVLGGVHPTLDPEGVLASPAVDYVIRGEGERPLADLADALTGRGSIDRVEGLCRRVDGRLVVKPRAHPVEDLDDLPSPDYGAFPVDRYVEHFAHLRGLRGISMIVSRGCPFQCSFCAVHQTMSRKWRTRSPERVVDDIVALRDRWGVEGIWFKDSIFNLNPKWTAEFCRLMVERKVGISWQALTRIDLVDEDELRMMRDAGLTQLDLGIESGSPRTLQKLRKGIDVDQIREKVRLAKRYVKVFGFFMIGIPGEEEADVEQTFALARELELDRWSWSIYSPLPGSELFEDLVREGKISPRITYGQVHFTEAYQGVSAIPPDELKELYRQINEYFCHRTAVLEIAG
jgi:radical SAM superfamily enzyme YgiQ (UPF0313 family)